MPRGGARPGAGRKPKERAPGEAAPAKKPRKAAAPAAGFAPAGEKLPGSPESWPFGTEAPAAPPAPEDTADLTPLDYFLRLMRDPLKDERVRFQAAAQALPYMHPKKGEAGKKAEKQETAEKVASKFGARPAPLKIVGGRG
ncbi:hypothetical protein [Roseateles puraquae]|uniref:hypothetical protein n=1 Tax=Roseateles puraquae TaxID=431059 RepID=UPI0031DE9E34